MAHHLFIKTFKSFGFGDNSGSLPSLTLTSFQSLYGLHFFQHFSILTILEYMSYGLLILQTLPELSQLPTICEQLLLKADLNTQLWFFLVDNDSHRNSKPNCVLHNSTTVLLSQWKIGHKVVYFKHRHINNLKYCSVFDIHVVYNTYCKNACGVSSILLFSDVLITFCRLSRKFTTVVLLLFSYSPSLLTLSSWFKLLFY